MPQKVLRSLIHEKFPHELRVKLELLSRRHDINNEEKHQELIMMLREYNVGDIVQLGPGTNRYAFKLDGFVIKFATDSDGKIDNMKEFKMAKRLWPHVIMVNEVSGNGTIMVCEYIQPFESYSEMLMYQEQILGILKDMSTVYLIGDVGLTEKNYANWGLRISNKRPVCLDFAYVYDVKSSLFECVRCGNTLSPTQHYTDLRCVGCGKQVKFESIRSRIGNDVHNHEIGDLGDEGYRLLQSHIDTQLDTSRSNYLNLHKQETNEETNKSEDEYVDTFVMK